MKTIIYSRDGKYYYIHELACTSCRWFSVKKFDEKPEMTWIMTIYQYDGKYYRTALPFTFWKIKHGEEVQVPDDHELVQDFIPCHTSKQKNIHLANEQEDRELNRKMDNSC